MGYMCEAAEREPHDRDAEEAVEGQEERRAGWHVAGLVERGRLQPRGGQRLQRAHTRDALASAVH